ncbi:hypothetical protein FRC06_002550 [Ceratobasidium sp. 370]|nr:hypothetical protein FRC06_002550 [Ceratobasidium sp. 370]
MSEYEPFMRDLEWSLVEGIWRSSLDSLDLGALPAVQLVKLVVEAKFEEALSSDLARQILTLSHTAQIFAPDGNFNGRLESYFGLKVDADDTLADLARLAVAVACLHAYIQLNWTGPDLDLDPLGVLTVPTPPNQALTTEALNAQAVRELAFGGEPAYHLTQHPILLRLAQIVLARGFDDGGLVSGPWWNLRTHLTHQRVLDEAMMPYIARVIAHPRNWSVHTMALLLRARLESTRTRTVERSALQLQALVDQMPTADSELAERLLFVHSILLPSKWAMEQELAHRYLSIGVVKSALEIFERLEMWEEVVRCYQSIEQRGRALEIVRDLLEGRKAEADIVLARGRGKVVGRERMDTAREAKLWCLLGELDAPNSLAHYTRAWDVSGGTSARAARALGGYHFARGEYGQSIPHLQKATGMQPLNLRAWFLLGCACVREESWEEARDAFARCVGIDEEDGESWNNIASVYMRMEEKGLAGGEDLTARDEDPSPAPATVSDVKFTNKMLAFRALKQGLKYSYENWRMWQNYIVVAVDVGELSEACRALGRLVELRAEKDGSASVDVEVLERLVDAVTRAPPDEDDVGNDGQRVRNPDEGHGLFPGVHDLFTRVVLPRVSDSPRIYRTWARLLVWRARSKTATHLRATWSEALGAHMDAYRAGVGSDPRVETDVERWREGVAEIGEVVDVMRNLGPRAQEEGDGRKGGTWQFQARSLVRTFMGRTKTSFGDEPEWDQLKDLLDELKNE